MEQEHRRAPRFSVSMAVTLSLRDTKNNLVLADPFPGELKDVSLYGVRLSIPHIRIGKYHLFYACSDDSNKVIQIETIYKAGTTTIVIPAHPIWFDQIFSEPVGHFDLGMEFLVPPEDQNIVGLHTTLGLPSSQKGGWLKKLLRLG